MSWQLHISVSLLLVSVLTLIQRVILKNREVRPTAYAIFFQYLTGIFIASAGFLFGDMRLPNLKPLLPNLIIMATLYGLGVSFVYQSLKLTEASKFTIIFSTRAFFTVTTSSLILGEFLSAGQIVGALLIFLGVVLANLKATRITFGRGELFALLSAAGYGLGASNDRYLLDFFDVYLYSALAFFAPGIVLSLIYPKQFKHFKPFFKRAVFYKVLLASLIYTIASINFFSAFQVTENSSQVAAFNLTGVMITVILAIIFLKERKDILKKIVAAATTLAGLLLVA